MLTENFYELQDAATIETRINGFTDGYWNMSPSMPLDAAYMSGYDEGQGRYYDEMFAQCLDKLTMMQSHQDHLDERLSRLEF